jgi:hypothetical protein
MVSARTPSYSSAALTSPDCSSAIIASMSGTSRRIPLVEVPGAAAPEPAPGGSPPSARDSRPAG